MNVADPGPPRADHGRDSTLTPGRHDVPRAVRIAPAVSRGIAIVNALAA